MSMLKAADFSPGQARRRRLHALGAAILTGTGLAVYGLTGPAALPALDNPSAYSMTSLAPHVVVYSVPTQASAQMPTQTTTHTETHRSTDTITDSTTGATPTSGPHDSSNNGTGDSSNSNSTQGQPGTAGSSSSSSPAPAALPGGSTAAAGSIWPPLQTLNGTPQLNSAAAAPASGSAPAAAQTVAQPAEMLMAIQCPSSMPTGSLCLEAVTSNGTAAALPSTQNLGSLPVTSGGPSTCPTAPSTGGGATSDDSSNTSSSSGDSSSGGSSNSSRDSNSDSGSKHSGIRDSGHKQKAGKKHSKKGDNSADLLPDPSGSSTATVASCGLLDQAVSSSGTAAGDTGQVAKDVIPGSLTKILRSGQPKQITLHTTGYSFQDNQGGNNSTISCSTIHKNAGGDGTYNDPITAAVPGHAGQGTQIPCGTEIYVPGYQRYIIVEDTGATKYTDAEHTDIYVGGEGTSAAASKKCMDPVTTSDGHPIPAIENPPPNEPVDAGPITGPGGQCQVPHGGNSGGNAQS
jgi:3D (Asp-Asp-Asp) domain-containing protein